jgi:uncharacterized coiled-coil DUF342 family protein
METSSPEKNKTRTPLQIVALALVGCGLLALAFSLLQLTRELTAWRQLAPELFSHVTEVTDEVEEVRKLVPPILEEVEQVRKQVPAVNQTVQEVNANVPRILDEVQKTRESLPETLDRTEKLLAKADDLAAKASEGAVGGAVKGIIKSPINLIQGVGETVIPGSGKKVAPLSEPEAPENPASADQSVSPETEAE